MIDISKITIPQNPGIYLMKDSDEKIIYIGKAKNLKNRVRSYFNKNQNYKTQKLVENISDIEYYDDASTVSRNEYCFVSDADPQYHEYLYQFVSNNSKAHGSGYWRVSQAKKIEVEDGYQNFAYYYSDFVTIMNLRDA